MIDFKLVRTSAGMFYRMMMHGKYYRGWWILKPYIYNDRTRQLYIGVVREQR